MTTRLGIDVGGTFTDIVAIHRDGTIAVEKVASTPQDPSIGVIDGIERIHQRRGVSPADVSLFAHGSTVATNALLESKLPPTALVVTRGFADVLEIGTQLRPDLFNLRTTKPAPYVPREHVIEVTERIDRQGRVVTALTSAEIERVVRAIRVLGVRACAIVTLFSFRNPAHEEQLAEAITRALPEVAVAISSRVAPEIKEYPRASTTAASAALQSLVASYMNGIIAGIERVGMTAPLYVMQSNGGIMTAQEAASNAHRMVLSGPAAGVLAATHVARNPRYANQITFDMGGTSTDIALIHQGRPQLERETLFEGRPLLVPQYDIHTIGSGGGSLAHVDQAGLLRVGPQSAGANPGPACYGRGGIQPTTTDAQVVLGRIDPSRFLGGEMVLDRSAAGMAIRTHVAEPLGLGLEEAAIGILEVADSIMARGVRVVSVNRGFDPRDFYLLAFGGAGPMHAASVAALVEVGGVLIPSNPGAFSAVGLADSNLKYDFSRVVDEGLDKLSASKIEGMFEPLIDQATDRIAPSGARSIQHLRIGRFRYAWQDSDVDVVLGDAPLTEQSWADAVSRFHEAHAFTYGHSDPGARVELSAISLESYGILSSSDYLPAGNPVGSAATPQATRPVYFRETGWTDTPVFERRTLVPGSTFGGPAIVEEREATAVVPPRVRGNVDGAGNIVLSFEERN